MKIGKAMLIAAVAIFCSVSAYAQVKDRIVAVVNDDVITLSELNSAFEPYQKRFVESYQGSNRERALSETRAAFLNRMVDNLLMEQESRKTGITVRNEEVTEAISDMQRQRKMTPAEFLKALQREGITPEDYRKEIQNQLVRMKLIRRDIKSRVAVTDEEIGAYYRKHRDEYEGKEAVRIKQILLRLPKEGNEAAKEKLRQEANAIHRRLLNGEPFDQLSARFSQGPAASEGGDIGFIEKGIIVSEVEEAAFALPLHQISGVIESSVGFHIIQVADRRGAGIKAIETVREEIREKIDREKLEKKFDEWIDELRRKSHVEMKL